VKDHLNLLTALAILQQRGVRLRAAIAGDGALANDLRVAARELGLDGQVRWLGSRSDIEVVLRALDIFVLSSRSEGMSNTILEAMASALPVVATDVGGAAESVQHGRTGLLVPAQDSVALADAIGALAVNPARRRTFGAAGRARAERDFAVDRMIQRYEGGLSAARRAASGASGHCPRITGRCALAVRRHLKRRLMSPLAAGAGDAALPLRRLFFAERPIPAASARHPG
jgi:glycosyltransferase involved in cell wall biosynthesis